MKIMHYTNSGCGLFALEEVDMKPSGGFRCLQAQIESDVFALGKNKKQYRIKKYGCSVEWLGIRKIASESGVWGSDTHCTNISHCDLTQIVWCLLASVSLI